MPRETVRVMSQLMIPDNGSVTSGGVGSCLACSLTVAGSRRSHQRRSVFSTGCYGLLRVTSLEWTLA